MKKLTITLIGLLLIISFTIGLGEVSLNSRTRQEAINESTTIGRERPVGTTPILEVHPYVSPNGLEGKIVIYKSNYTLNREVYTYYDAWEFPANTTRAAILSYFDTRRNAEIRRNRENYKVPYEE